MKNKICQSCGMPLHAPEMYGTDPSGIHIEDYCVYCFKDGCFTQDATMEEMIQLCATYVEGNARETAITNMRIQFPALKRWAQKEETQHEYHKSIRKVMDYIQNQLHEITDLKTLSQIANISPYHFHRIFKATIGESLAEYVKRLRLEYVAEQLKTSDRSLSELAESIGYSSEQALSRAFKHYFNLPPKIFKASFFENQNSQTLIPRVCKIAEKNIISLCQAKPDKHSWQKLYTYAIMNQLLNESCETLEVIREGIYYPSLAIKEPYSTNQFVESNVLKAGLYIIFTHKGPIEEIPELYNTILSEWLPSGKYKPTVDNSFVIYLNSPAEVAQEDLLSEIYIPVAEE